MFLLLGQLKATTVYSWSYGSDKTRRYKSIFNQSLRREKIGLVNVWLAVTYSHEMNHGVPEKHKIHAGTSNTVVILFQVHLQPFFKTFERWNLYEKYKKNKFGRFMLPQENIKERKKEKKESC